MKKDKFDQLLHSKLTSYEQTPPDDVWATIEANTTRRPSWIRRLAVPALYAAGVAAMVCVAFLLPFGEGEDIEYRVEREESKVERDVQREKRVERDEREYRVERDESKVESDVQKEYRAEREYRVENKVESKAESVEKKGEEKGETKEEDKSKSIPKHGTQSYRNIGGLMAQNTNRKSGVSVSAYVSMANRDAVYNNVGMPARMLAADYLSTDGYMENSMIPQVKIEEHHFIPLTLGTDIRIPIAKDWGLQTGLSYSYLSSTFSHNDSGMERHQKAHFVGVPVSVTHDIAQVNALGFYASAGGTVQKCVSATDDFGSSLDKPWQYALNCAAGIEYSVSPHAGIYLQPELRYNINNSSSLHTAYTAHPINFTLKMGVIFN